MLQIYNNSFYRVCQESLNNVAKHAGASQVTIALDYGVNRAKLQIRDNGRGSNPAGVPSGRKRLSIMRKRARAIGADLEVASRPDHGTDIFIRWLEDGKLEEG